MHQPKNIYIYLQTILSVHFNIYLASFKKQILMYVIYTVLTHEINKEKKKKILLSPNLFIGFISMECSLRD